MIYTILPPCLGAPSHIIVGCSKGGVVQEPWQNRHIRNNPISKIVYVYNKSFLLTLIKVSCKAGYRCRIGSWMIKISQHTCPIILNEKVAWSSRWNMSVAKCCTDIISIRDAIWSLENMLVLHFMAVSWVRKPLNSEIVNRGGNYICSMNWNLVKWRHSQKFYTCMFWDVDLHYL